jgi:hypothetical protein
VKFGLSLADFYFLNPVINTDCTNLWLDTAYCVSPVGSITTYSGYPTASGGSMTQPYTLTSETYTTATWSTWTQPSTTIPSVVPTAKPLAPGSWSNCSEYRDVGAKPPLVNQWTDSMDRSYYQAADLFCNNTADRYAADLNSFLTWNPSLIAGNLTGNCTLLPNFRYCAFVGTRKLPRASCCVRRAKQV